MFFTQALTVSLLISTCFCATLRFYGANQPGGISNWERSKTVRTRDFTVCPDELPTQFTLVCIARNPASFAEFFIDGSLVKTERVVPYTIAGDFGGKAQPWNPPTTANVECRLSTGETVKATINFLCDGAVPPPRTRPPVTAPPAPAPPSFELGSGSVGSSGGVVSSDECVKIPALSYVSADLGPRDWLRIGKALVFRPTDSNRGISSGSIQAVYKFTAPVTSTYGFTLDMETNGGVDHNDVWVTFEPSGFVLQRGSSVKNSPGKTKAYHNRNGRSNQVYSVDFDPHSFSTRAVLQKGRQYTVKIGARSTKTGFYSIIMFPCNRGRGECDGTRPNTRWQRSRDKCASL